MRKYLLGVLSGILLTFLTCFVIVMVAFAVRSSEPAVESNSVLVLPLRGAFPEDAGPDLSLEYLRSGLPLTLLDLRNNIKKAAADDRIRALALDCGGLQVGWAKAQEIRWDIEEFKKSGKPVIAFLQVAATIDYLVASAADQVYMAPEGVLDLKGLRAEPTFYKDTLAKIGIEAEIEHIGKYKSAGEMLSRSSMSDANREVVNSILDEVYGQLLEAVAGSRKTTPDELRRVIDHGPFIAEQALANGLVDGLKFEDQFYDEIRQRLDLDKMAKIELKRYHKIPMESLGLAGGSRIAVVYGVGQILRGSGKADPLLGSTVLGSDSFSETLRQVREDKEIKGVIVRVDSPGGDAIASDQMWREMNLLDEAKPVIISMSDVAASGGYYLAMTGSPILAYPGTYTGSIGVIFGRFNLRGLYEKIGVKKEILKRGYFADIDTDYRPMTPEEREKLRSDIEAFYRGFVTKVAEARSRPYEEIHEIAQGRVWMGSQALRNGLIDELGGFDRAVAMIKQSAGLQEDDRVTLVPYPPPKTLLELLLDREELANALARYESADVGAIGLLREQVKQIPYWRALLEGGMMRIAPYWVTVQ
jgi:protease IV